jgi:ketosteroid isomerase-like protein
MPEQKAENDKSAIRDILGRVMNSVHKLDYEGVRDLIPDDGHYFGSVATVAYGYEELYEKQFIKVWPNIDAFNMVPESIAIQTAGDFAWATCLFESSASGPDGKPMERKGRMTFIFARRDGLWLMVHSHDSLYPTPPK